MSKPILLDAFCGAGGATRGYQLAGFTVIGVDIKPQPRYVGDGFYQGDALEFIYEHGHEFDVIHASPPCQKHTTLQDLNAAQGRSNEHIDWIPVTRRSLIASGKPYIIENVQGAPVLTQIILCGYSLGLPGLARHRHFESNLMLMCAPCTHRGKHVVGIYGNRPDGHRVSDPRWKATYTAKSLEEAALLMGIDWMEWNELKEAIPPAYSEFIGKQLMTILDNKARKRRKEGE